NGASPFPVAEPFGVPRDRHLGRRRAAHHLRVSHVDLAQFGLDHPGHACCRRRLGRAPRRPQQRYWRVHGAGLPGRVPPLVFSESFPSRQDALSVPYLVHLPDSVVPTVTALGRFLLFSCSHLHRARTYHQHLGHDEPRRSCCVAHHALRWPHPSSTLTVAGACPVGRYHSRPSLTPLIIYETPVPRRPAPNHPHPH
ncbi:hypothetical protein FB45DRAFT_1071154, partial [Roridomyces roridus]